MISLPQAFVDRIQADNFVPDELLKALDLEVPTAIRINPLKRAHLEYELASIPWSSHGNWLSERPIFTLDPLFHAGAYYSQEAGSQVISKVFQELKPKLPEKPIGLDLCAAPGGKSTLLLSEMKNEGLLVANELIQNRAVILKENIIKWGYGNVVVTNNKPSDFEALGSSFDFILVDAPCSGEGMFRKDERARSEWKTDSGEQCSVRQKEILESVWACLNENGYLIYSTCTFNPIENEEIIQWLIDTYAAELVPLELEHFEKDRVGYGFYALPNRLNTEGFYCCVVQKKTAGTRINKKNNKSSDLNRVDTQKVPLAGLISEGNQVVVQWKEYLFRIDAQNLAFIQDLKKVTKVIYIGTEIGELMPKGVNPSHALAMNQAFVHPDIQRIALTKAQALQYLQGQTFPLNGEKGFALVQYEGVHLGWIKHLGNRFNNLYPKEWRIRMRID